jgi:hypothetical protein
MTCAINQLVEDESDPVVTRRSNAAQGHRLAIDSRYSNLYYELLRGENSERYDRLNNGAVVEWDDALDQFMGMLEGRVANVDARTTAADINELF